MDFLEALKNRKQKGCIPVVPDIKCYSPKDGELLMGRDPIRYAKMLEAAGSPALSVVTEEKEFHGSMKILEEVCKAVKIPVLRKDFIEEVQDLDETAAAGASAILLMVCCLGKEKLQHLYDEALSRGLTPLVETHTAEELEFARSLNASFVGINNRDILQLERDDGNVSCAKGLLQAVRKEEFSASGMAQPFVIVESSLKDPGDVRTAITSGADAVLVGTALLQAKDPAMLYQAMSRGSELKICGVMNKKDVDLCTEQYVDWIGFVTEYPIPVPWNIERGRAKELIRYTKGRAKTCVVTGGSMEKVVALAKELEPDFIQIHYKETFAETVQIAEKLHETGIKVIRSVPSDPVIRQEMFGTANATEIIELLSGSPVDRILLDSRDAGNAAVGGENILDSVSEEVRKAVDTSKKEFMIGGGITDHNIREALQKVPAACIDIMTGSEDGPGSKSKEKIRALTEAMALL